MTKTSRHSARRGLLFLTLPLALVLSACGTSANGDTSPSDVGETSGAKAEIVVGSLYEHEGYDPLNPLSASANGERLVPVFDTLLRVGTDGDVAPQLAESMESENGTDWVLSLRDGVTFTDDTPLDAEAVIYNIERHRAPDTPSSSKYLLEDLEDITATDEQTVQFTLGSPNWSFPYLFTASGALGLIGSPTALEADAEGFNRAPIGAGPYIVEEWMPDDHVTMKANPDYWGGAPEVETLTYRILPDPQARENALVSGQIDITSINGNFEALSQDDSLQVYTQGNRGGIALLPNVSSAPFDDERIREAVQIAIDPQNSKQVLFGQADLWDGTRGCLPFADGSAQCEPNTVETDVEKAKELVSEYIAAGNSADVEILSTTGMPNESQYVDQVLKEIGLNSTIKSVGPGENIPLLYGGDFQFALWQMVPFDSFYPLGYTIFSGEARDVVKHSDSAFDAALSQGVNGETIEERDQGLKDAQSIWNDEAYVTWLGPMPQFIASAADVDLGPDYLGGFAFYPADIIVSN